LVVIPGSFLLPVRFSPMILIGQYDSLFVRRVAVALRLYGLSFEHRPWSMFDDSDKFAPYNPLRRAEAAA
jgi:glutathione S-transferase